MPNPIILLNEFMTGNDVIHAETLPPLADPIARELNDELVCLYGQLLPPAALAKVLGFPSGNAFCQAVARGNVRILLLDIPNRRGRFALARDVAVWLSEQRRLAAAVSEPVEDG